MLARQDKSQPVRDERCMREMPESVREDNKEKSSCVERQFLFPFENLFSGRDNASTLFPSKAIHHLFPLKRVQRQK